MIEKAKSIHSKKKKKKKRAIYDGFPTTSVLLSEVTFVLLPSFQVFSLEILQIYSEAQIQHNIHLGLEENSQIKKGLREKIRGRIYETRKMM